MTSACFLMHDVQGADDTTGVAPDEKIEIAAPGRAIAKAATAAADAAEAAEAERTRRRRRARGRSSDEPTGHSAIESRSTVVRAAISPVHDLHG